MIKRIEDYLFDFIGLMVPGFLFVFISSFELYIINKNIFTTIYLWFKGYLYYAKNFFGNTYNIFLFSSLLIVVYIIGDLVKILSKIFIEKLLFHLSKKKEKLKAIIIPLDYSNNSNKYIERLIKYFNQNYKIKTKKLDWDSNYKLYKSLLKHYKIENYNDKFVAKYNMYRSISFISIINVLILSLLRYNIYIVQDKLVFAILVFSIILCVTFYIKYKRYWKLAGDEILLGAFILINNKDINHNEKTN